MDTSWFGNFSLDESTDELADQQGEIKASTAKAMHSATSAQGTHAESVVRPARDGGNDTQAAMDAADEAPSSARTLLSAGVPSFVRLYRTFLGARAALAVVLLAVVALGYTFGPRPGWFVVLITLAYVAETLLLWWLPAPGPEGRGTLAGTLGKRAWFATIGVDIGVLATLHAIAQPSNNLNLPLLMALPVLMAGVMTPRLWALASAAAVTLALLGVAWLGSETGGDLTTLMTQAGLVGAGLFAIAVLAGELAIRLASEQASARGSLELARQQAQLNRLVIDEMHDGVLVIDRRGRVRAANPAARRLLVAEGRTRAAPFQLRGVKDWEPLVQAVEQGFLDGSWPAAGREITLPLSSPTGVSLRELRLRVRFTKRKDQEAPEDLCVLFIEDVRNIYARMRQEKLAAMGRMSAGIAHEIRNPLAAISQANALLAEDASTSAQHKLTSMVHANVERLKRIVDDVLDVAPGERAPAPLIDVAAAVGSVCEEWRRTAGLAGELASSGPAGAVHVHLSALRQANLPTMARIEPDHLRRILVNLLDNAWRHSTQTAGAVTVRLDGVAPLRDEDQALLVLRVANDGDVIAPKVERSLFEPFFSTRSLGTGLGLYICRELCERYDANIDYRQHDLPTRHRNEFIVTLPAQLASASSAASNQPS